MNRRALLWILCIFAGVVFDLLFFGQALRDAQGQSQGPLFGLNFLLFSLVTILIGLLAAWREGRRPAALSLALLLPWALLAGFILLRAEPLSSFLNVCLVLVCMVLLAAGFLAGSWPRYSLLDYPVALARLGWGAISLVAEDLAAQRKAQPEGRLLGRGLLPYARGALLALPVLGFFTVLLVSADAVFSEKVSALFDLLRLERLPETIYRTLQALGVGYLLAGVLLYALNKSGSAALVGDRLPLKPFLGFTEAGIVLGSVVALFAAFVSIQVRYFFGGETNIGVEGFTYAQYARRGFGELVAVAFFALMLFLLLSAIAQRQAPAQRRIFSGLGVALLALVSVILASAFQRLLLYEQVYGFTRMRTYPKVFMIWIGLLLLAVVILELTGRLRFFGLAALLAVFGFTLSLNLMNVDGFVTHQNLARMAQPGRVELDFSHLAYLSSDAVPELARAFADPALPEPARQAAGGLLACRLAALEGQEPRPWQVFHLGQARAEQTLRALAGELQAFPVENRNGSMWVEMDGEDQECRVYRYAE